MNRSIVINGRAHLAIYTVRVDNRNSYLDELRTPTNRPQSPSLCFYSGPYQLFFLRRPVVVCVSGELPPIIQLCLNFAALQIQLGEPIEASMSRHELTNRRNARRNVKPPSKYLDVAESASGSEDDQPRLSLRGHQNEYSGRLRNHQVSRLHSAASLRPVGQRCGC